MKPVRYKEGKIYYTVPANAFRSYHTHDIVASDRMFKLDKYGGEVKAWKAAIKHIDEHHGRD